MCTLGQDRHYLPARSEQFVEQHLGSPCRVAASWLFSDAGGRGLIQMRGCAWQAFRAPSVRGHWLVAEILPRGSCLHTPLTFAFYIS
ncbi:hypothetical protein P8C59_000472 [Phyllachora maydis]|uniref:Uncharacterized protein n=1 Tax=Phyllachora maydis TaxID=1825666 RepID=A0AAD9HXF7_9PEZI|nr:hypothetical protein P8C59_000472 [Phyllachora maydis]